MAEVLNNWSAVDCLPEELLELIFIHSGQTCDRWSSQQSPIDIKAGAMTRAVPREFCIVPPHFTSRMGASTLEDVHPSTVFFIDCIVDTFISDHFGLSIPHV